MRDVRLAVACRAAGVLLAFLAAPLAAQTPGPDLPRVVYGATPPQVIYGPSSAPPPEPAPVRPALPAEAPRQAPRGSLTYESGPAYYPPPALWLPPPRAWHPHRPPPPGPPNVSPRPTPPQGFFERPLSLGRDFGPPPRAPATAPGYGGRLPY